MAICFVLCIAVGAREEGCLLAGACRGRVSRRHCQYVDVVSDGEWCTLDSAKVLKIAVKIPRLMSTLLS